MAAELALGIAGLVGTIDVCIKTGKSMVQACKDYRQSDAMVNELIVRVEICWSRIVGQLEISKELWTGMTDDQKELQSRVLLVLQSKLVSATQVISKTDKHATLPKIRALHVLTLRESLETTVSDLEAWQQRFEPSWFHIIKTSTSNVEILLRNRGLGEPAREGLRFRRAFDNTHSVLISEESFQSLEKKFIPYCKAQLAKESGDDKLHIIDTVSQETVKLRDARELASRLRDSNPFTFGTMKCKGIVRLPDESSLAFVFRVPEGFSTVESCRKRLLSRSIPDSLTERLTIARQLVTAVYYVHLYEFVHKSITPETILTLRRTGTEQDAMVVCLVGFQLIRNANALTNTPKRDRKSSVYQHPSRMGTVTANFVMQHDIYSLGVCLLEIGLWTSFVDYGDNDTTEIAELLRTTEDTPTDLEPETIKKRLISLSRGQLKIVMGDVYSKVVETCLTCLDEDNTEFGDPRNFEDQDGVEVGSRREGPFTVHLHDDPEAPPMSPPRRERWEIVKPLGRGGQGEVVLERCVGGLRNLTERAYSRYFVKSLGWYPTRDHLYLAMEYHSSGDLYNYIKLRGPLPETDCRHVVTQVLSGIAMMHAEGFAHRDVKPKNILIHRYPQGNPPGSWWVKLADFGISKRSNRDTNNTTIIMGTRLFMAPELLRPGPPDRLDRNYQPGDIWALGITAFYILTKKLPFKDEGTVIEFSRSSGQPFPSDYLNRSQVTRTGQDFIKEVMDPQPNTRLDSDAAMQHAWTQPLLPDVSASGDQSRPSSSSSIDDFLGVPRPLMTITSDWTPQPASDEPTREYTHHDASSDVQSVERFSSGGLTTQESTREHRQSIYSQSLKNQRSMTLQIVTYEELSFALRSRNVQAVKLRLQRNPNIVMEFEWTPLLLSAAYGNVELAKFLITNGADIFATRDKGNTPLHVCASVGHQAVGRLLIENGANIEARTGTGYTPLQVAAHKGHEPVVRLLVESGAKIEEKDEYGRTSLILATGKGHQGVVRLLLERDADIGVKNSGGDTPLIQAVKEGHLAVVKVLLEKGADVEVTDKDDKTPLIIASQRKQKNMVKLLEQNGAKKGLSYYRSRFSDRRAP
ncbi:CAMK kinase [Fusarium heterosporum]|uniref:CAMK kinase n=1 Tax=Fusarium heterosporum TaxID=42747 RepID=A0A8H5SW01_FUSHE|nr:CAMK kinase [Fusarium heterosporum]